MVSMLESYKKYTYSDYLDWSDGNRCELIDGIVYMMSAPNIWHQRMVRRLIAKLDNILEGGPCEPLVSPVDVRLFPKRDDSDDVVVQPDVVVVCDDSKLSDDVACNGAPDVVFEVMSDSSALYDLNVKKALYEKAGVKEYWIIAKGYAIRWLLDNGKFVESKFERGERGIELDLATLQVKFYIVT